MPAYGYARRSSMRGDGHEVSPETQEREVRALAARHHDDSIEWLSDWDTSGRGDKTAKRVGYLQLVDTWTVAVECLGDRGQRPCARSLPLAEFQKKAKAFAKGLR